MKTSKNNLIAAATVAALTALTALTALPAWADAGSQHPTTGAIVVAQAGSAEMADGEVRKVDTARGKVTLKHGEIKSLNMPPMTMVFSVKNKALLDSVKPGDKVRFKAVDDNGTMSVVEMTPAR